MKNKTLNILFALLLTTTVATASDKIHVTSLEDFYTAKPSETIDLKVIDDSAIGKYNLSENDIIHCNIVSISKPKRGKMSAGFKVSPVYYTHEGEQIKIDDEYIGKYSKNILSKDELKNIDKVKAGKKAALSVGNHFVKGVAPVAALAEGMIKNEDGNRLESGVKQVYKSSPISYVEKGQEIKIQPGDSFYIVFKSLNGDDDSNETNDGE